MIQKIKIRNPGCEFCRYYLPSFKVHTQKTTSACLFKARIIYQSKAVAKTNRKWRWCNCQYALEKNKSRYCCDFKVKSPLAEFILTLKLRYQKAGVQLPPAFAREKWWDT